MSNGSRSRRIDVANSDRRAEGLIGGRRTSGPARARLRERRHQASVLDVGRSHLHGGRIRGALIPSKTRATTGAATDAPKPPSSITAITTYCG